MSTAFKFGSATVSNAVKAISHADFGFSAGNLAIARSARITARTGGVMFTYSGDNPTTTAGHLLAADASVVIEGIANISALKFIREASTDGTVSITLES